jgi:hypothetical protein
MKMKHHEPMKDASGMVHHEKMRHHEAMQHKAQKGGYEHEVDKPSLPKEGHLEQSMGCSDYKKDAMDIAYGQATQSGCKSDGSKIISQFKNYGWTD